MERLTEWDEYGNADIVALSDMMLEIYAELSFSETNALTEALNRLATYEDTGLEPEEIKAVIDGAAKEFSEYDELMPKHRIKELAQAKKDGRLVVLPCKVDATAYQWKKGDDIPSMFRFNGVSIDEDGEITYQTHWGETFKPDDFGKTVFLTHEEAVAELKKREDADNEAD